MHKKNESKITADCYWCHTGFTVVIREFLGFISEDDSDSMQYLLDGSTLIKNFRSETNGI